MAKALKALLGIAVAVFTVSASPAVFAATLLGPGTYTIGPLDTHGNIYFAKNAFTTDRPMDLSLRLEASTNPSTIPTHPFIHVAVFEKGGGGLLYHENIKFDGDISVDLPTVLANLPASPEGTSYALKVLAFLGVHGGDISGTFTLSAVPIPPALLLFGSALVGFGVFSRRRREPAPA
ncbi:MAG: hypothetical protein AB7V53_01475 [Dongiaceae bacterium]